MATMIVAIRLDRRGQLILLIGHHPLMGYLKELLVLCLHQETMQGVMREPRYRMNQEHFPTM